MTDSYLWFVPNSSQPGHRGDDVVAAHNSLDVLTTHARTVERHGWDGALIPTSWRDPDAFTVATALAARTESFEPLVAIRPGHWHPAQFAKAAATLDQLSQGRLRVNVVTNEAAPREYGDDDLDRGARYARTAEFLGLVRRLWTEDHVTHHGEFYRLEDSTVAVRPVSGPGRPHPPLYFGGASPEAEAAAAVGADVQLLWGEDREGIANRIERLRDLSRTVGRTLPPLQFGLRLTTVVRESSQDAWDAARERVAALASERRRVFDDGSEGQKRLIALARRDEVLDDNLYTAPGLVGGDNAFSTWLVGSAEEVAASLEKYRALGVSHFILSDTPYLSECARIGDLLLPLLRR